VSETRHPEKDPNPMTLGQGDLRLLESEVAQRLLSSRIPARFAYLATDGTPRVLATRAALSSSFYAEANRLLECSPPASLAFHARRSVRRPRPTRNCRSSRSPALEDI
jgi:hypothetical protein